MKTTLLEKGTCPVAMRNGFGEEFNVMAYWEIHQNAGGSLRFEPQVVLDEKDQPFPVDAGFWVRIEKDVMQHEDETEGSAF